MLVGGGGRKSAADQYSYVEPYKRLERRFNFRVPIRPLSGRCELRGSEFFGR